MIWMLHSNETGSGGRTTGRREHKRAPAAWCPLGMSISACGFYEQLIPRPLENYIFYSYLVKQQLRLTTLKSLL